MAAYTWPGNIRQLENVLGNACMMVDGTLIDIENLHENVRVPELLEQSLDESFLPLDEVDRRHTMRVLDAVGGNKARAAEVLGIGQGAIYQILSKMKIVRGGESS
jgi:two-component system response regulator HydG